MGIRIHKDIAYYLSPSKISSILVDHYQDILDELYYDSSKQNDFIQSLATTGKNCLSEQQLLIADFEIRQLSTQLENKTVLLDNLMKSISLNDEDEGLMLFTPSMSRASRNDDLIDYYENTNAIDKVTYLHRPIYPDYGYVYLGGLEDYDFIHKANAGEPLEIGKMIESTSFTASILNKELYQSKYSNETLEDTIYILTHQGYFHPFINEIIYVMAYCAQIIKPEVSQLTFNSALEPAIIQAWY